MQCASCGYDAREGAAFCGRCGAPIADTVVCTGCSAVNPAGHRFCEACGRGLDEDAPAQAQAQAHAQAQTPAPAALAFAGGRYVAERVLGEGGRKRVYLARDTHLDRDVAFALLRPDTLDAESQIRLRREAQAMGRVGGHPSVVTVHDVGDHEGRPYIVSEYMSGGDVHDLLRAGPLGVQRAIAIAADVCGALAHAHGLGVIHRDVKPGNIWLAADGSARLGDFGLALMEDRTRLSQTGLAYGTPLYMSPEQALGNAVDGRSDLYSLGVLLYELLTGRPPFLGDDPVAIVTQHLHIAPVAPTWHNPEIPQALESLVLRLLAKPVAERPADPQAVLDTLTAIQSAQAAARAPSADAKGNPLDRLATGVYVGRQEQLERLRAALDAALSGRPRPQLVAGEPGIGKTRIAEELATYAQLRGCDVLWGRVHDGAGAPPYWPWTQILRAAVRDRDPESLVAELGAEVAEIAHVLPELGERASGEAASSELARFRLFDSVSRFLVATSRKRPLVLVLEDLHSADEASLLLLRFLAREAREARLLIVATLSDVGYDEPLARAITELTAVASAERITLHGLAEDDVARLIELTAAAEPDPELVARIHRESEGNPLYVGELVRLLAADERLDDAAAVAIPEGVRAAIGLRLDRLSGPCRELLAVASVIGREFDATVLQGIGGGQLADALEEAIAARVVLDAPPPPGHYRFSHGLVRKLLYEELPSPRRARLHEEIAAALERVPGTPVAQLARHYVEAGHEKGVQYAVRAARQASERLAFEEAAAHYRRALASATENVQRCDLELGLGEACAHAGDLAGAKRAFQSAAELARRLSDSERLARAALGYGGAWVTFGVTDEHLVGLLEEARGQLGDGARRAMVLARTAVELYFSSEHERRAELAAEAVSIARRLDDPEALAYTLNARHLALWEPENAHERLAIATEIVALAQRAGSGELALQGHARRVTDLLELGEIAHADDEIAAHAALAEQLRDPGHRWYAAVWRATRAQFEGRFDDAERLAGEALELGSRLFETEAAQCHTVQMFFSLNDRGRGAELEQMIQHWGEEISSVPGWHAAAAMLYSELDRPADAHRELDAIAGDGFRGLPRDNTWLPALACAAEAVAFLGDAARAEQLYELLLPYDTRNIVAVEGWICLGSAERLLGLLAAVMRRWQESETRFEQALKLNKRMGARPWLARTQLQYAEMLLRREDKSGRAAALLEAAGATARELGMSRVLERSLHAQRAVLGTR